MRGVVIDIELALKRLKRQLHRFYAGCDGTPGRNVQVVIKRQTCQRVQIEGLQFVTFTTPSSFSNVYRTWTDKYGKIHNETRLSHAWRKLALRQKRVGQWGPYFAVREWNKAGTCEHIHCIFKGVKFDFKTLDKNWSDCVNHEMDDNVGSVWVRVQDCYSQDGTIRGLANYVAKYLSKQVAGDPMSESYLRRVGRNYWYSSDWIFPGWLTYSKLMWRMGHKINLDAGKQLFREVGRFVLKTRLLASFLSLWDRDVRASWSITLSKELRRIGLIWDGVRENGIA